MINATLEKEIGILSTSKVFFNKQKTMNLTNTIRSIEDFFTEKRLLYSLLGVILIIVIGILVVSDGFSGGTESLNHFKLSRWAFSNPEFFLNNISKPVYTILSAPFALLGFKSFQLFNILIGIATGYISYLVAKELKMKSPILAIVICCFTPVFMINLFSGATEILFAFTAILATYFLVKEKYIIGAIVVSFLPVIKNEGFLLILIYGYYFVHKKHFKEIIYTLSALVLFSIIGLIFGKNPFWLFADLSKLLEYSPTSQGGLFQLATRSPGFFGIPNEIFFVTGLIAGLSLYIRQKREYSKEFLLIVLPFLIYFIGHSLSSWSGIGGLQGTSKNMAAIVPFMAIMATRGLYIFAKMFLIIFKIEWIRIAALVIGVASVIHIPFAIQNYPIALDSESFAINTASKWTQNQNTKASCIYYSHPSFFYFLNSNIHDQKKHQIVNNSLNNLKTGDLFIYDEHYSNLTGIKINKLIENPEFELLRVFDPKTPFSIKETPFRIAVFRKINSDSLIVQNNKRIIDNQNRVYKEAISFDFDNKIYEDNSQFIGNSKINPSSYLRIKRSHRYYLDSSFELDSTAQIDYVEILVEMKFFAKTPDDKLKFVLNVFDGDEKIEHKRIDLNPPFNSNPEEWTNLKFRVLLPSIDKTEGIKIQTFIWNKKKGEYLIDDYKISYRIKKGE